MKNAILNIFISWFRPSSKFSNIQVKKKTLEPTPLCDIDFMLLTAAQKGDFGEVKIALKKGANVDAASMRTKSPYGFQNANMDPEVSLDRGRTALMYASDSGHEEMVNTLLSAGASVNAITPHGGTALMHAAFNNHVRIAQSLIERGADIDFSSLNGTTALIYAAQFGHVDMVRYFLSLKADRIVEIKPIEEVRGKVKVIKHIKKQEPNT